LFSSPPLSLKFNSKISEPDYLGAWFMFQLGLASLIMTPWMVDHTIKSRAVPALHTGNETFNVG
jgi:hypothetical protein